jgi:hypothetical protein
MSKLPAIQFYPGDWRKDPGVQSLSFHDRGVWFEILLLMHESAERGKLLLNGNKMPDDALARLLGLDKQNLTTTLTTLLDYGVASLCETTGAIICRRMIRDEDLRQVRKTAGKLGGNPLLLKQKPTTKVKQKPTPSTSSSTSTSAIKVAALVFPESLDCPEFKAAWSKWEKHRREIRKRLTPESIESLLKKLDGWGLARSLAAIDHTVSNGWQGLREPEKPNGTTATASIWPAIVAHLGRIDPYKDYSEGIAAKFGNKALAAVKSIGVPNINQANEYQASVLAKRFRELMQ